MLKSKLKDSFTNPGAALRGKPFWAWNGKLEEKELRRQIRVMKEMGFGGFFMHSRSGLETEYLGKEWFELINACTDEAEKQGMEAWLYDEDRWPSGSAGGLATKEDKYKMKYLRLSVVDASGYKFNSDAVAVFSCTLDGLSFTNCKKITSAEQISAGKSVLEFTVELMECDSFYNDEAYLDTMSAEATEHFINITHEKYKEYCGKEFGKTIKGMFTDEPHRGMVMSETYPGKDAKWVVPFTPLLFDEFEAAFGYDLVERLPELFLWKDGEKVSQVKWHYVELLERLFLKNFAKPTHDWCRKNNLLLTGHILHEDTLATQTIPCGSVMRYYEYMDYPGVDVLTEDNRNYWIVKLLSSAARQLGKKWLLSELYGCTGWQMSLQNYKEVGDWQSLFGITLRCPHLSWYTMKGQAKRDYPASIFHQSGWYKEYETLETYFSRLQSLLLAGDAVCDVLVLNPVESIWAQVYPGCFDRFNMTDKDMQEIEDQFQSVFFALTGAHIDFDYGDEDMIARLGSVEGSALKVGKAAYKTVVVPQMTTIRSTTLDMLKKFKEAGGKVIFAGKAARYVDAASSNTPEEFAKTCDFAAQDGEKLAQAVKQSAGYSVEIIDNQTGKSAKDIFCQLRKEGDEFVFVAINTSTDKAYKDVTIRLNTGGFPQVWDCRSGKIYGADFKKIDGLVEFGASFEPSDELAVVITGEKDESLENKKTCTIEKQIPITGDFEYSLSEPNICVLDMGRFKIGDGQWQDAAEVLRIDGKIRDSLGLRRRSGHMVQPWFKGECKDKGTPVAIEFGFNIAQIPSNDLLIAIEEPKRFDIFVNDKPLEKKVQEDFWLDICFSKLSLPKALLKDGCNTIRLETAYNDDSNTEAIYLLGDFGAEVNGNDKTLTKLPEKLKIGDITNQGLPFYSGKVAYKLSDQQAKELNENSCLLIGNTNSSCVRIKDGKGNERLLAFKPYKACMCGLDIQSGISIELVLTRRNTFGPLHLNRIEEYLGFRNWYGPAEFETTGELWSDDYRLIKQGLLEEPVVGC